MKAVDEGYNNEQIRLLEKALGRQGFRFVIIEQNHKGVYQDIILWLKLTFPDHTISELQIQGKDYHQLMESLVKSENTWITIPDFDLLFEPEYESVCTALNQRRDFFARKKMVLLCFIMEGSLKSVPTKIPDLWSLRSLELNLHIETFQPKLEHFGELSSTNRISSLGGSTFAEKTEEIENLKKQVEAADPENLELLQGLYLQISSIYYDILELSKAMKYAQLSLKLSQKIGNKEGESRSLNGISKVYYSQGYYEKALENLHQSLKIAIDTGNKTEEGTTLNNISLIFLSRGEYQKAMEDLQQSLKLLREIGDEVGEGTTLNNISQIFYAIREYQKAFEYLEQSLKISQGIGDKFGEGATLCNISGIYSAMGDYHKAMEYLKQSLEIQLEIGDKAGMISTLHNIAQIALFNKGYDKFFVYESMAWEMARYAGFAIGIFKAGQSYGENVVKEGSLYNGLRILKIAYNVGKRAGFPGTDKLEKLIEQFEK